MTCPATARAAIAGTRRVVVKVGSGLLAGWGTHLDRGVARGVVAQICDRIDEGLEVVLVCSGAVALGCERLGIEQRPEDIPTVQAAAAIGQGDLVALYQTALLARGRTAAQVLVTHADLADRRRFLNARHALNRILALDAVPIVNENDTVAVEELKVGDNDTLAAHVANLVAADLLVILTDQDGLHTADPRLEPDAARIALVTEDAALPAGAVGEASPGLSVGGMATKVEAARRAAAFGVPTVLVDGREPEVLRVALSGADVGTLFLPSKNRLGSRKAWIAGLNPAGRLLVDTGAAAAVAEQGRSLLPAGITGVEGVFENGEPVALIGPDGGEVARGLTAYSSTEVSAILGRRTSEIRERLGYHLGDAVVHRDDLVVSRP